MLNACMAFQHIRLQIFEMDTTEKWRLANWHKDHGVSLFANEKLEWAFRQFSLALQYIISLALDIPEVQHNDQVRCFIKDDMSLLLSTYFLQACISNSLAKFVKIHYYF